MGDTDTADTILHRAVERALRPYRDLLPPDALEALREQLFEDLAEHPVTTNLVRRLRPPPAVPESDEVAVDARGNVLAPTDTPAQATGTTPKVLPIKRKG